MRDGNRLNLKSVALGLYAGLNLMSGMSEAKWLQKIS